MLIIACPYCGEIREEQEFSYAGEALIQRPSHPHTVSDEEWGNYLFHRTNPKGLILEQWAHTYGCRKVFLVERSTIDNQITQVKTFAAHRGESL